MSLILSIETATNVCSVALHRSGELLCSQHLHIDKSHSGLLTVLIESTLKYAELTLAELAAVAVSEGPGSYTGLRIGISTAKGLAFSLDVPVITINTLQAMGNGVSKFVDEGSLLCPMIDARRMEVYCMLIEKDGRIFSRSQSKIIDEAAFQDELDIRPIYFFGNGAAKTKALIGNSHNAKFVENIVPSAVEVGELAWDKFKAGDFADLAYFEPFYLKEFQGPKTKT